MENKGIRLSFVEFRGFKALTCATTDRKPRLGDRVFAVAGGVGTINGFGQVYGQEDLVYIKDYPYPCYYPNLIIRLNDELSDAVWGRIEKGAEVYLVDDEIEILDKQVI